MKNSVKKSWAVIAAVLMLMVGASAPAGAADAKVRFNEVVYGNSGCGIRDIYGSISGYKQNDGSAKIDLQPLKVGARVDIPYGCNLKVKRICLTTTLTMSGTSALATSASLGTPNEYFGGGTPVIAEFAATYAGTKCKSFNSASASYSLASENGMVFFNTGGRTKLKTAVVALKVTVDLSDGKKTTTKSVPLRVVIK